MKILIQLISIYRAIAMFIFILFYTIIPQHINLALLVTAILSDLLDGYLARKYNLASTGGKLLDLFSDKYLNCISIIYLIIEHFPLLPLILILTKEVFVLSFRSIEINGRFVISTNRFIGGLMSTILWIVVFFHISNISFLNLNIIVLILGLLNLFYLVYKIVSNISSLEKIFKK